MHDTPQVTVAICTRDRASDLRETMPAVGRAVAEASSIACEILVIDDGSKDADAVAEAAKNSPVPVRLIRAGGEGLSKARNLVLEKAMGEVILFTDDDVRPEAGWVEAMTRPILRGEAGAVAGAVRLAPELDRPWMGPFCRQLMAATDGFDFDRPEYFVGANMAFRRDDGRQVGGFLEELGAGRLGAGEETHFAARMREIGVTLVGASGGTVVHHFDPSRLEPASLRKRAGIAGKMWAWFELNEMGRHDNPPPLSWRKRLAPTLRLRLLKFRLASPLPSDQISDEELNAHAQLGYLRGMRDGFSDA